MPENTSENTKFRKLLKGSPNLKEIDALLMSGITLPEVRKIVTEKYGETYSVNTYQARRTKLRALALEAKLAKPDNAAAIEKVNESLAYQLKTLGEGLQSTIDLQLDKTDPSYQVLEATKKQIQSFLRRSAEFFSDVDHLGLLRYALNVMQQRISMLHSIELRTNLAMRDNTDMLQALVDMVAKSIEIHQWLGLKPKFGDPTINLQVNVGNGGQVNIGQTETERFNRLKALEESMKGLPQEEKDRRLKEIFLKRIAADAVDAQFVKQKLEEEESNTQEKMCRACSEHSQRPRRIKES